LRWSLRRPTAIQSGVSRTCSGRRPTTRSRAAALLETPHPGFGLASGLWARRELLTTAYDRFAASLPEVVARGGVPSKALISHLDGLPAGTVVGRTGWCGGVEVRLAA
jgi:hypothetical protein